MIVGTLFGKNVSDLLKIWSTLYIFRAPLLSSRHYVYLLHEMKNCFQYFLPHFNFTRIMKSKVDLSTNSYSFVLGEYNCICCHLTKTPISDGIDCNNY